MSDTQAYQVPLPELLRTIPTDHCVSIPFQWAEDGTETGHHHIPVGRHMHDAAELIDDLERENADLRAKLAEAERKLAKAEQRGADAARREAAGICEQQASEPECPERAQHCAESILARIGQPVEERP